MENNSNEILVNQSISFNNLLHFREKITTSQNIELQSKIAQILKVNEAKNLTNTTINITHGIELQDGQQVIDMEMFIPLDKPIYNFNNHNEFNYINELCIENAIKLDFKGNQQDLQFSVQRLMNYIKDNQLSPKTPLYTATIVDQEVIDLKGSLIKGYLFIGI